MKDKHADKDEIREILSRANKVYIQLGSIVNLEKENYQAYYNNLVEKIINNYTNMEKPDACIVHNNTLIGIEVFKVSPFEVDGNDISEKASHILHKQLEESINLQIKNGRKIQFAQGIVNYGEGTKEKLLNSFKRVYNKHILNLGTYEDNLIRIARSRGVRDIQTMFLVDLDYTHLIYVDSLSRRIQGINPYLITEINETIQKYKNKPDYIMFVTTINNTCSIYLNDTSIDCYTIELNNDNIVLFTLDTERAFIIRGEIV